MKCQIAVLDVTLSQTTESQQHRIHIVDLNEEMPKSCKQIGINIKSPEQLTDFLDYRVLIAEDFSKVMFSYQDQNYLCEEKNGKFCQSELSFLNKRKVKSLRTEGGEIFIFCCKDYDKDLDVYSTSWLKKTPTIIQKRTQKGGALPLEAPSQQLPRP